MPVEPLRGLSCIDDPATRRAVDVILRRCGYHVIAEVGSAAEAIVAAGVGKPDAVVLDLALTGDLGLGVLAALHAASPGCAVIVVSSFDTMRPATLEAGAYDFLANSDLRVLERSLLRLAAGRPAVAPDGGSRTAPAVQLDGAPTSVRTSAAIGSLRTKAPAS
jgi:DNA-binding NarL/FixJ family response regulator